MGEFGRTLMAQCGRPDRADEDAFLAARYRECHVLRDLPRRGGSDVQQLVSDRCNTSVDEMVAAREGSAAHVEPAA